MVSRSERVVTTFEELLGSGELYHYHSKLMMKEARTGGQHVWHQDYGYWYENGCLYPDMGSVFIALDPCTTENGCLQVLSVSVKHSNPGRSEKFREITSRALLKYLRAF